jgi:hypothetical protein
VSSEARLFLVAFHLGFYLFTIRQVFVTFRRGQMWGVWLNLALLTVWVALATVNIAEMVQP